MIRSSDRASIMQGGQKVIDNACVVRTDNLTKIYMDFWGKVSVRAVHDLTVSIERGEVFGLLGPNGSGKTTTVKLLLGLLFPTHGSAEVLGFMPGSTKANSRIGFLPEESYLYRFLNAEETLDFYGRLFKIPRAERRKRIDELIEMVGLGKARKRKLREYSKGMSRRIGLAQALINDPELVILDEPTTGLDPIGVRQMKDMMLQLREKGKTVLLCSHLLADVQDVCDRITILYNGETKVIGPMKELLSVRDVTQIRAREISEATKNKIAELIKSEGELLSIENPTATLEDLFLRVVRKSQDVEAAAQSAAAGSGGAKE